MRGLLAAAAQAIGGPSARLDAELLLAAVLGRGRAWLRAHDDALPAAADRAAFHALVARRARGEPVAYLTGRAPFWTLELDTGGCTLVPRPETELLVEQALAVLADEATVLDLGSGSGAIALALARERPRWRLLGIDRDAAAVAVARANAVRLGISNARFERGDWYTGIDAVFDLIVSNPPYIEAADPCLDAPGLRFEPRHALASGPDGLDALRTVVAAAPAHLRAGGWLLCEHGADQGAAVRALFADAGFAAVQTLRDLAGHERITRGRR